MKNDTAGQSEGKKAELIQEDLDDDYYLDSDFDDTDLPEMDWEEDIVFDPPAGKNKEEQRKKMQSKPNGEEEGPIKVLETRRRPIIAEEINEVQREKIKNQEFEEEKVAKQKTGRENRQELPAGSSPQKQPKQKKGNAGKVVGGIFLAGLLAGGAAYGVKAQDYKQKFFPNTWINGINVGNMTIEEVKEQLSSFMEGYQIRLTDRDLQEEVITKDDIGLYPVFDGTLEQVMENQNPYFWGIHQFKEEDFQINTVSEYDQEKFSEAVSNLKFLDPQYVRQGKEAYLSEYIPEKGYEIIPKDPGNEVDKSILSKALSQAVLTMKPTFSLEDAGCYIHPLTSTPDPALVEQKERLNRYATMTVTYTFGNRQEVLNGDEIHQWISFDENNQPLVDETKVSEFVERLAKKYNTAYTTRKFKTSYGSEVDVSGFYGWRINQKAEAAALAKLIAEGESVTKEPEYSQEGASHDGNDYGNTYAEVNLTAQHMFLYKDGQMILESDFVSGNVSRGFTTPPGIFGVTYKQRDAVLKGQGYASPVKFWMPFNGGIGFHDASWRNTFGGSIYRTNGSHGCINMPYNAAKTLFENIYKGMPVICYNLDGTGSSKSISASGSGGSSAPAAPAPAPTPTPVPVPETVIDPLQTDPALLASSENPVLESNPELVLPQTQPEESIAEETAPVNIPESSEVVQEASSEAYMESSPEQTETVPSPTGPGYVQTEAFSQPEEQAAPPAQEQTTPPSQEQPAPEVPSLPENLGGIPAGGGNPGENLLGPGM